MSTYRYIYPLAVLGLFVLLVNFQLYRVYATPLWLDDSYFAGVAKNLVLGKGYSGVYYDKIVPFDAGITAGPVVILPAALMIALFGNGYWVPGLTSLLLISALLMLAFHQLKHVAQALRWQCGATFLLATLLLTNHEIGFPGENMMLWYKLLGEVPGALLVIIASLHIGARRQNPQAIFAGGIIAGLAALCKLQSLIGGGVLGAYLAASYFMVPDKTQTSQRQGLKNLFFYGLGVLIPLILFEAVKLESLGMQSYLAMMGKMIFTVQGLHRYSLPGVVAKLRILGQYLGIGSNSGPHYIRRRYVVLALTAVLAAIFYYFLRFKRRLMFLSPLDWAAGALASCAAVHLLWWILIGTTEIPRHSTQGIIYGCAALALWISCITSQNLYRGNIISCVLCLVLLYARSDAAAYFWAEAPHKENLAEDQQVRQVLSAIQNQEPGILIFSCGNALEMEYLLPKAANFTSCDNIFDPTFAHRKRMFLFFNAEDRVSHPEAGKNVTVATAPVGIFLRHIPEDVRKLCPNNDIYAGKHYFIASCHEL